MLRSERLNRYLARHGVSSRREADQLIAEGRVSVNGVCIRELGSRIDPDRDLVEVDDERVIGFAEPTVLLFHKPVGVLSTCKTGREKGPIILEYLPSDRRLFPIGRLDRDSSGLLLVTDDGELANLLTHPRFGSTKVYRVGIKPALTRRQLSQLSKGVELEDGFSKPIRIRQLDEATYEMTLGEGRKRQIRRMVAAIGAKVVSLVRIEQAGIRLGNLAPGRWRELSSSEIKRLRKLRDLDTSHSNKEE